MGYSIAIGDAVIKYVREDRRIDVEMVVIEEAGGPGNESNSIYCSYTSWDQFLRASGLKQWFEEAVEDRDSGNILLQQSDLDLIKERAKAAPANQDIQFRLQWLEYWIDKALKEGTMPVMRFS